MFPLLQHHFDSQSSFLDTLPQLVRNGFFPQGVRVGPDRVPVTNIQGPFCQASGDLVFQADFGEEAQTVWLGPMPLLTPQATLRLDGLIGNEDAAREYVPVLQLRLKPEVRLARLLGRQKDKQAWLDRQNNTEQQRGRPTWTAEQLDNIDTDADLANYAVRGVGDLLRDAVRAALSQIVRCWNETPLETPDHIPGLLLPCLPQQFTAALVRFLKRSDLCQPLDTHNPLAELAHKRKVTFCGQGGLRFLQGETCPERFVHSSQAGRLCPVETTESARIGLNLHLSLGARLDGARLTPGAEPDALLGLSASLIPFVAHDDMNRAMMGSKNMKQALPLADAEPPLVRTGWEARLVAEGGMADGPMVWDGMLALGVNLRVAYLPWYGYNFEDALVVSEDAARRLTSRHADPPFERPLQTGDKLSGRHGNKGVVARLLPTAEMPRLPDGAPMDVLLNPHGVLSRMNIGQLFETHWGAVASARNQPVLAPPFRGPSDRTKLADALAECGLAEGRSELAWTSPDGRPCRANVVVGVQYLMKLDHNAADKAQARGTGPRTPMTCQPARGRRGLNPVSGGQRVGEMEVWALLTHGAAHNLGELMGCKSDRPGGEAVPEALRAFFFHLRTLGIAPRLETGPEKDPREIVWDEANAAWEDDAPLRLSLRWAEDADILAWAAGREVKAPDLIVADGWRCSRCGPVAPVGQSARRRCPNNCGGQIETAWAWHAQGLMGTEIFGRNGPRERLRGACLRLPVAVPHPLASAQDGPRLLRVLYVPPPAQRPPAMPAPQRGQKGLNSAYQRILTAAQAWERAPAERKVSAERALIGAVAALFGQKMRSGKKGATRFVALPNGAIRQASLTARLEGKAGLVRGYLLGKRCDFSGRAVIVPDPTLPFGHCRLPRMALDAWAMALPPVSSEAPTFPVLLNRAPSLHRYSLLAFEATAASSEGATLALHPLCCGGFGADFDGDTMAFHLPLGSDAQAEARARLAARQHLFSAAHGGTLLHLTQDIVAGLYLLTADPTGGGASWLAELLQTPALALREQPFTAEDLKRDVSRFLRRARAAGPDALTAALNRLDVLMRRGFQEATERGLSFSVFDLAALTLSDADVAAEASRAGTTKEMYSGLGARLDTLLQQQPTHPAATLILSGARGDAKQLARLCASVTRFSDGVPSASYLDGLPPAAYFQAAQEAREDMLPKKLGTPLGGALTRNLAYGLYPVHITQQMCNDMDGLTLPASLWKHLLGRVLARPLPGLAAGVTLDAGVLERLQEGEGQVSVFSPFTCRTEDGLCARCYGWDLATDTPPEIGLAAGVLAAQSIGERATQDFMKVFQGVRGAVNQFAAARALLERGVFPMGIPATPVALLRWLTADVYDHKVNLRHFEVALRVVLSKGGAVAAARAVASSPFAAAAFQSPTRAVVGAAQAERVETFRVGAAAVMVGRLPRPATGGGEQ